MKRRPKMVDELVDILKNGDEIQRREAAHKLGSIKSDKGLRALVDAFGDDSWLVREMAVESICTVGDESGMALFFSVLKDGDARVRNSAVKILTGLGEIAIDALINALEDEDDNTVRYSADCLGDIGDKRGIAPLLKTLEKRHGDSRYYIILALGKLGDSDSGAVEGLLPCLNEDMWIQSATLEALGDIGDSSCVEKVLELMKNEIFLAAPACDALGKIGDVRAVSALLSNLDGDNEEILSASVKALFQIKEKNRGSREGDISSVDINREAVTKALITTLNSDDAEARTAAAVLLGWLKAEGAIKPLTKLLEDDDYDVSKQAGETLAKMGDASVDSLMHFVDIPEKRAKLLAIQALEEINDERAISYALNTIDDEDEDLKIAAINLLGKIGDQSVGSKLYKHLDEQSELVRNAAVRAVVNLKIGDDECKKLVSFIDGGSDTLKRSIVEIIGLLKFEDAKEELEKLLLDKNVNVKQAAVFSLAEIEGRAGVGSIPVMLLGSEDPVLRKAAAIVIGKLSDIRGVQPLMLTAQDSDPWVRYHSIQSLKVLKDSRTIAVLKKGINDPVGVVRIASIKALWEVSPDDFTDFEFSLEKEDDDDVRLAYLDVLAETEKDGRKGLFIESLKDPSWKVRESAVRGLSAFDDDEAAGHIRGMTDDENIFVKKIARASVDMRD